MDRSNSLAAPFTAAHRSLAIQLQPGATDTGSPGHNPAPQLVSSNRDGKQFSAQYVPDSPAVEAFGYSSRADLGRPPHLRSPALRSSQSCVALPAPAAAPSQSALSRAMTNLPAISARAQVPASTAGTSEPPPTEVSELLPGKGERPVE